MTAGSPSPRPGLGNPRLVFAFAGALWTHEPQREFALVNRVTTIGSEPTADLCLGGLKPFHAEIRHDDEDNFTYTPLGLPALGSVNGRPHEPAMLRTGTRIVLGGWTLSFCREEFADGTAPLNSGPGRRFSDMRDEARSAQRNDV